MVRTPSRRTDTDIPLKGCPVVRWGPLTVLLELLFDTHVPARPRTASDVVHHQLDVSLP